MILICDWSTLTNSVDTDTVTHTLVNLGSQSTLVHVVLTVRARVARGTRARVWSWALASIVTLRLTHSCKMMIIIHQTNIFCSRWQLNPSPENLALHWHVYRPGPVLIHVASSSHVSLSSWHMSTGRHVVLVESSLYPAAHAHVYPPGVLTQVPCSMQWWPWVPPTTRHSSTSSQWVPFPWRSRYH